MQCALKNIVERRAFQEQHNYILEKGIQLLALFTLYPKVLLSISKIKNSNNNKNRGKQLVLPQEKEIYITS